MKLSRMSRREERKLLDFAGSYLSEAFPNPDRKGCPPEAALRLLASRPKEADLSLTEHLSCCSPCFKQYQALLEEVKSERQAKRMSIWKEIWAWTISSPAALVRALVIAAALASAGYLLVVRLEHPKTVPAPSVKAPLPPVRPPAGAEYSEFVLDLSGLSPTRRPEVGPAPSQALVKLPRARLDLFIYLPLGSEEKTYRISLGSKNKILWAETAAAHLRNRKMTLEAKVDMRKFEAGKYAFEVQAPGGIKLSQPVWLENVVQNKKHGQP